LLYLLHAGAVALALLYSRSRARRSVLPVGGRLRVMSRQSPAAACPVAALESITCRSQRTSKGPDSGTCPCSLKYCADDGTRDGREGTARHDTSRKVTAQKGESEIVATTF
jgi:hypothetical protein